MSPVPCQGCGVAMDGSRAEYDTSGRLLCPACSARSKIAVGNSRADTSVRNWAFSVAGLGFLSLFFDPFLLVSLAAAGGGIQWLVAMARDGQYARRLGGVFVPCVFAAVLGLLMALVRPALLLLALLTHAA